MTSGQALPAALDLIAQVNDWIAHDPDPDDRAELGWLLQRSRGEVGSVLATGEGSSPLADGPSLTPEQASAELADRFSGSLQFGTAGLRGAMAPGPNRMNRAVVMRAAAGLIAYLSTLCQRPIVVIGNDARHHSRQFALDTAAIITAAGGQALLLPDAQPTPLLAYAVKALTADAGVMVTASHNPAADNGYKVYLGGRAVSAGEQGAQIVPPYDAAIAAQIGLAPPADQIPRAESGWTELGADLLDAYLRAIAADPGAVLANLAPEQAQPARSGEARPVPGRPSAAPASLLSPVGESRPMPDRSSAAASPLRIVHTAMHGVGSLPALRALHLAGFDDVISVAAQAQPDPDFPTVAFPNPEEPGAIDLALSLAAEVGADLVIANDPDADRCAVAVDDRRFGWRMLSGDELGSLLGSSVAQRLAGDEHLAKQDAVLANSIVSSRLLAAIAQSYGIGHRQTLTGFKWIGRVPDLAFGYEEAIGFCCRPDLVRDKDGLSTAVAVARLAAAVKATGRSLVDLLDDLARQHGLYLTSQLSVRLPSTEAINAVMARLRRRPPAKLLDSPVEASLDLNDGYLGLLPTDGWLMLSAADDRVIIRPSGTEPKVKCYLEVVAPVDPQASFNRLTADRAKAADRLNAIKAQLLAEVFA
jgi:phosphomannomutase